MTVLVAFSSRHGATGAIARAIADELIEHQVGAELAELDREVAEAEHVRDLGRYDAVVLGSAIYMGRWMKPAADFAHARAGELADCPVWLFSSGPIGDPPKPSTPDTTAIDAIVQATGARDHRLFSGRLDKSALSLKERAAVRLVGPPRRFPRLGVDPRVGRRDRPGTAVMSAPPMPHTAAVDLSWIPLGAGGCCVRFSGRVDEAVKAGWSRRDRFRLYHTALAVELDGDRYTIRPRHRRTPPRRRAAAWSPLAPSAASMPAAFACFATKSAAGDGARSPTCVIPSVTRAGSAPTPVMRAGCLSSSRQRQRRCGDAMSSVRARCGTPTR